MQAINKYLQVILILCVVLVFKCQKCIGLPKNISRKTVGKIYSYPTDLVSSKLNKKCEAGKSYVIKETKDLFTYKSEIQCVYLASISPTKVPEGAMVGDVVTFYGLQWVKPIVPYLWYGKFVEKVTCDQKEVYRGWNNLIGDPTFTFITTLGKITDFVNVHPLDYKDERESLIFNYWTNIQEICPNYNPQDENNQNKQIVEKSAKNRNFFPINKFVDVIRIVGRQEDGGLIYLGQSFIKNQYSSKEPAPLFLYFFFVNYDKDVNPDFKIGEALPPLEEDVYYREAGLKEAWNMLIPVYELLTEPVFASTQIVKEVFRSSRGFRNFIINLLFGSNAESRKFQRKFQACLPQFSNQ